MGCPICCSEEYEEVRTHCTGEFGGYDVGTGYYECKGCSVLFKDVKKFYQPKDQMKSLRVLCDGDI